VTEQTLARGEERFGIYCSPCHEKRGTGRGILFQYGSVPTPSFHEQRIIDLPDGEIFDVITNSKGLMPAYGYPVPPADRWAIIAHLRRLQRERQQRQLALAGGAP
jgi:mono/diheme cytochrome c family protein